MDLAGTVVGACCSCVLPPLVRQLGYVAKVGERVEDLVRAMRELKARSTDVTARIEDDQRIDPTRLPTDEVEEWLRSVGEVEYEVYSIKDSYGKIRCRCLCGCSANICSNWKIGRKATNVLLRVNYLSHRVKDFVIFTRAGPPPPGQLLPGTANLRAMKFKLKKVMKYLDATAFDADIKARTIGIFGMGGVGKTTLLKAINNKLCSGGMVVFQHVIWMVVSSDASVEKLQKNIADILKLPLPENATSEMRQAAIFNFLNNKKFILLLDDVWERLDLGELGIPDSHRFVLFTTRSWYVCGEMEAGKKIKVGCLQKNDAWRLFVDKVGKEIIHSSPEIKNMAEKVAAECEGLPLALTVLGRAMASKRTPSEWQNTLESLKKSQPGNIQEPVLHILKNSYDSLRDEAARRCFLFCALYPEDYSFCIDELIQCFWRHGLVDVDDCSNYGQVYGLIYNKVVGVLRSACLLEADDTKVKMHDVIRDMALWIARDCGGDNTKWIVRAGLRSEEPLKGVDHWEMAEILSLQGNDIRCLPMPKRTCEKMSTLMLRSNRDLSTIPKGYLKCFPALTYLDLSHTSIMELPEEVSSLIELQYLNLSCTLIESLSISLKNLKKLKHLSLRRCDMLKYIPYGLISCLLLLQSLDMYGCYSFDFSSENFIGDKAHLEELKTLEQLKFIALVKKGGRIADLVNVVDVVTELALDALQDSDPKDFITNLMKIANGIENLKLQHFRGLKELILTSKQVRGFSEQNLCFSRLGWLVLKDFQGLRKIRGKKIKLIKMFPRLTRVEISGCWDLQNLTWTGHLPCLRNLFVTDCKGLKEIISADEDGEDPSGSSSSIFPSLCFLYLDALENLHSISNVILDTPKLSQLIVIRCPKLKTLPFSFQQQITEKREIRLQLEEKCWHKLEWYDISIKNYLNEQREISLMSTLFNFI